MDIHQVQCRRLYCICQYTFTPGHPPESCRRALSGDMTRAELLPIARLVYSANVERLFKKTSRCPNRSRHETPPDRSPPRCCRSQGLTKRGQRCRAPGNRSDRHSKRRDSPLLPPVPGAPPRHSVGAARAHRSMRARVAPAEEAESLTQRMSASTPFDGQRWVGDGPSACSPGLPQTSIPRRCQDRSAVPRRRTPG